jgi:hypothetical protein
MSRRKEQDISCIVRVCEGNCNPRGKNSDYAKLKEYVRAGRYDCTVQRSTRCMGGCGLGKRIDVEYNGVVTRYAQIPGRVQGRTYKKLPEPVTEIIKH